MATYHSLELNTGRSFWLTTQESEGIVARRIEANIDQDGLMVITPQVALSNALQTHLIMSDWCSEGWRLYINSLGLIVDNIFDNLNVLMQQLTEGNMPEAGHEQQFENAMKILDTLRTKALIELQQLNLLNSRLKQAKMVMGVNVSMLGELKEYYSALPDAFDLPEAIRTECTADVHEFKRRLTALERFLESECLRSDTLMSQLEDSRFMVRIMILDHS